MASSRLQFQPLLRRADAELHWRNDAQPKQRGRALEQQVAGQAVIDGFSGADLLGEGRLDQGKVEVSLVVEPARESRRLFQRGANLTLRHARRGGLLDKLVPVDAAVAEPAAQAFGEHFAAAERAPGNDDYGHGSLLSFPADCTDVRAETAQESGPAPRGARNANRVARRAGRGKAGARRSEHLFHVMIQLGRVGPPFSRLR